MAGPFGDKANWRGLLLRIAKQAMKWKATSARIPL